MGLVGKHIIASVLKSNILLFLNRGTTRVTTKKLGKNIKSYNTTKKFGKKCNKCQKLNVQNTCRDPLWDRIEHFLLRDRKLAQLPKSWIPFCFYAISIYYEHLSLYLVATKILYPRASSSLWSIVKALLDRKSDRLFLTKQVRRWHFEIIIF